MITQSKVIVRHVCRTLETFQDLTVKNLNTPQPEFQAHFTTFIRRHNQSTMKRFKTKLFVFILLAIHFHTIDAQHIVIEDFGGDFVTNVLGGNYVDGPSFGVKNKFVYNHLQVQIVNMVQK